jgi:Vitamin B6 photo-protection and homoeostasis
VAPGACITAGFVLPAGFPETVTPDYLSYQLWAVPAHVTVRNL